MLFYTYMTIREATGEYYVGRHSTKDITIPYYGSGVWIADIKKQKLKHELTVNILEFYSSIEELLEAEQKLLNMHVQNTLCMNRSTSSKGCRGNFSSKLKGTKRSIEARLNVSMGRTGIKVSEEGRAKLREARKTQKHKPPLMIGAEHPQYGKKKPAEFGQHLSQINKGLVYITDGNQVKRIKSGSDVPDGWRRGVIYRGKVKYHI